jgi:hypothetical protein
MRRLRCARVFVWLVALVVVPALAGCGQNSNTANVFDVLQTGLLGVTAAGSVAILRNL